MSRESCDACHRALVVNVDRCSRCHLRTCTRDNVKACFMRNWKRQLRWCFFKNCLQTVCTACGDFCDTHLPPVHSTGLRVGDHVDCHVMTDYKEHPKTKKPSFAVNRYTFFIIDDTAPSLDGKSPAIKIGRGVKFEGPDDEVPADTVLLTITGNPLLLRYLRQDGKLEIDDNDAEWNHWGYSTLSTDPKYDQLRERWLDYIIDYKFTKRELKIEHLPPLTWKVFLPSEPRVCDIANPAFLVNGAHTPEECNLRFVYDTELKEQTLVTNKPVARGDVLRCWYGPGTLKAMMKGEDRRKPRPAARGAGTDDLCDEDVAEAVQIPRPIRMSERKA